MELMLLKPDLKTRERKFREFLQEEPKFWRVLSDKVNELNTRLDDVKRLENLRKLFETRRNTKEQHLDQKNSLKVKLEYQRKLAEDGQEEIKHLKSQESGALEERREKENHIIKVWKAYRLVKHMYEERLGLQIHREDDVIIFKFTTFSGGDDKRYFVKLKETNGKMTFVDIVPKLKSRDTLIELLKEKNVQIFLACIWKRFKKLSKSA
ncbi:hypothetical protein J437_LFUL014119 [Ladona fulva]|uniref:Kinetochore protein SPC25 n=1 Tax=Ladona fulva TaxID=123851 RepID=A0A8K0P5C4_LADFU|nr:hypothetical protein J437_LFUL014119 [Ladona fulva]